MKRLPTMRCNTTTSAPSGTAQAQTAGGVSITVLVNLDNYADSIVLMNYEVFGNPDDSEAAKKSDALAHAHFLKSELNRYYGIDFNYPILASVVGDYDFVHDPRLITRIKNKFRRPAYFVYINTHGEYHVGTAVVHPFFTIGSTNFYSAFQRGQVTSSDDVDVSTLTAPLNYANSNAPFVWVGTCVSAAGGTGYHFFGGRDPQDFQWAATFGISGYNGAFVGSVADIPYDYDSSGSDYDWTIWERNFFDFMGAGDNNFQTALNRSFSVQSFTSNPSPPQAMVGAGDGAFAF